MCENLRNITLLGISSQASTFIASTVRVGLQEGIRQYSGL